MSKTTERKILKEVFGKESLKEKEEKPIQVSFFETEEYIYEEIASVGEHNEHSEHTKGITFIKFKKTNNEIDYIDSFEHEEKIYEPIRHGLIEKQSILLPSGVQEYGTTQDLIREIQEFIYTYVELPDFYHNLLPYVVLFYWISDKFPFLPYVHFVGLTGSGKSVALDTIGAISYKGIKCSGSLSTSSIFRLADQFRGSLLLNEFELGSKDSESYSEKLQILKSGTEDYPVFRVEGEGKKQVEVFKIKSPRIFASQKAIDDAALASRTIEINMSSKTRKLPLYRLESFNKKATSLRNKLLMWRLHNLNKVKLEEIEFGLPELERFDGRVQQIMTPIFLLADKETRTSILEFMDKKEEETKRERLEELDGVIFTTILEFWNIGSDITVGALASVVNEKRAKQGYKNALPDKYIGNKVRKILGIETEKTSDGYRLVLSPKKIEELNKHFGLMNVIPPVRSASSLSSHQKPKDEHSEHNEHSQGIKKTNWSEKVKTLDTAKLATLKEKGKKYFDNLAADVDEVEVQQKSAKYQAVLDELAKREETNVQEAVSIFTESSL